LPWHARRWWWWCCVGGVCQGGGASPEGGVVQGGVSVLILHLHGAAGLQQGAHHLQVALVGGHLQGRLTLVLDVHLRRRRSQTVRAGSAPPSELSSLLHGTLTITLNINHPSFYWIIVFDTVQSIDTEVTHGNKASRNHLFNSGNLPFNIYIRILGVDRYSSFFR